MSGLLQPSEFNKQQLEDLKKFGEVNPNVEPFPLPGVDAEQFFGKHAVQVESAEIKQNPPPLMEFYGWETIGTTDVDISRVKERLLARDEIDKYRTTHKQSYKDPRDGWGYATIPVLEFLWNLPLSNLHLAYIHGLRPESIRVTYGACTTDGDHGRITVLVENRNGVDYVTKIEYGIQVLYGCGADVDLIRCAITEGRIPPDRADHGPWINTQAILKADFS